MARRTEATPKRRLHVFRYGPTPGVCAECPLPKANRQVHCEKDDPRLVELEQAQDAHRRRSGDQP